MAKTVEEQYKELSEIDHILHRPGMWLGSMVAEELQIPVYEDRQFIDRSIEYIPGLVKLYDEIISNSVDEYQRTKSQKNGLNKIEITANNNGHFICKDNGGIPVVLHKDAGMYVQEMLFGRLRAGSNFDDTEKREGVGQNGVGASLVNVMSQYFSVCTSDGKNEGFVCWSNNMKDKTDIIVKPSKSKGTTVESYIDLLRFNLMTVPDSTIKLIERRCIIAAASNPGLEIVFNDETYKFNNFKEYVDMYGLNVIGEKNDDWEVYVGFVEDTKDGDKVYGVVNSTECNAGTHAQHFDNQVYNRVSDILKQKYGVADVTKKLISSHTVLFIKIGVTNPTYGDQAKTKLTTDLGHAFYDHVNGKKRWPIVTKKFTNALQNSALITYVYNYYTRIQEAKNTEDLKKRVKDASNKKVSSIEKLIDANATGKSGRAKCELWLFEGDSAAANFRNARSAETQGSYKLKGKVMNTLYSSSMQVMQNQELSDIIKACGLNILNPSDLSGLRFNRILIATDADVDGISITGQLCTFFITFFPELIRKGHIYNVKSPLVKAYKKNDIQYFVDMQSYEEFIKTHKGYEHKYFKGLGSLKIDDYRNMIKAPILDKFVLTDSGIDLMKAWMGNNANKRKEMLETV